MDNPQPGHTSAKHGKEGETAGVDLRGSSVPTNSDDVSMDVSTEDEPTDEQEGRPDRPPDAKPGRQQPAARRE